jgi:hypothetical protein
VNKNLCNQCSLRKLCIGFNCPSSSMDLYNNFLISSEINCLWRQWLYEDCVILNNRMVETNNLFFKEYLNKTCGFEKMLKEEKKNVSKL